MTKGYRSCSPMARFTLLIANTNGSQVNAHYEEYGFQPIVVFDGAGRFITAVLRPAKRPSGKEIVPILRRLLRAIRTNWPRADLSCAPTVIIAAPRFSTFVASMGSITSSAWRRPRHCDATSAISRPA